MAYTIVNGTTGSNFLAFVGISGFYSETLINPYTGYTVTISGTKNINNAIYDGRGGIDTLTMTSAGDVLTLVDAQGTIMVTSVEFIQGSLDDDIVNFASNTVTYGNLVLRGNEGNDLLWSNAGNDLLQGWQGNDILDGGAGNDILYGGIGNDYISGWLGDDAILGGDGDDTLVYNADAVWVAGSFLSSLGSAIPVADMIALDGKNRSHDTFHGDLDEFLQITGTGIDTLIMTGGNDVLVISDILSPVTNLASPRVSYVDIIQAGDGDDVVDLSGADNVVDVSIYGGTGHDVLGGSTGDDTLHGEDGNDLLHGASGNDSLRGGIGDDTYTYNLGDGSDTIIETQGTDSIVFGAGITSAGIVLSASGDDLLIAIGSDTITIQNHFAGDLSGRVESIVFDDGSTFDLASWQPNEAPVAQNDSVSGDEDTIISGNVLDNDSDANNDTLTVTPQTITTANGGSVVLNANGTFTYQGASNFHGNDSFTYTVNDGNGGSASATVAIIIGSVNDSPVASADSFSGNEDEIISGSLLGNDSDIDGDTLSAVAETITTANGGSVTINADGTFSYVGAANYNGADSFSYTLSDGNGGTSVGNVALSVVAVNDAPVATDDTFSGDEDTIINGNLLSNDSDVDGDTLSVVAQTITTANGASVTINANGTFAYQGAQNFHGNDSFTYTLNDGNGGSSTATVALIVGSVNDSPVASADSFSGNEDEIISGDILSNDSDIDGDTLSVVAETITTANGGTVTINADGTFSYVGASNYNGPDSFSYTLSDGNGGISIGNVALNIAAVNDDPTAQDDTASGSEDEIITGNVLGNDSDIDGDTLSVTAEMITTANGGTVTINADGTFSYQGVANFHGNDSFTYTVNDGNGGSATATVALIVGSVNDIPVASADSFSGNEDETISGNVLSNDSDIDGDTLSVVAETITTANGGSVTINADGTFSYVGAANYNGADSFSYTLSDGNGGISIGNVALNVAAVNDAPVAQDDAFSGNEDEVITGNLLANDSDVDGDGLTVAPQTIITANGGSVTINTNGTFTYQGALNFHGMDSFSYTINDGNGATAIATASLNIASINDAPLAQDDVASGIRNAAISGNVLSNDTDIDGDTMSIAQPGSYTTLMGGTITLGVDGSFVYDPANGYMGEDSFEYIVSDGNGGTDTGLLTLTITPPSNAILGTENAETLSGTQSNDLLIADGGDDVVKGENGDDEILGGTGNDVLYGDDGVLSNVIKDKVFDGTAFPYLKQGVDVSNIKPSAVPALGIANDNLTVDYEATASITFRDLQAGRSNSFGSYGVAADGTIVSTSMEWKNVQTAGIGVTHQIDLPVGADGGKFGFFIVTNGNHHNSGYAGMDVTGDGNLSFIYNYGKADARAAKITDPGTKISLVYDDGVTTKVIRGRVSFSTEQDESSLLNRDGKVHVVSGLPDNNNVTLNPVAADLATRPVSFTKNDMTISALTGVLVASADRIGVKSPGSSGSLITANEGLRVDFENGAESVLVTLSSLEGQGRAIDFKIFLNGDTLNPIIYEHVINSTGIVGRLDIFLDSSIFGTGLVTAIEISSISNSSAGVESFLLNNIRADIPGGLDTDTLRIGFEDRVNPGLSDYQDVLFDLNINSVTVPDTQGGNDILDGGAGNDTLYGEGGDDILIIGDGADQAYGGAGADVFALTLVDGLVDTIYDFNVSEDVLNITDILEGFDPLTDMVADFVRLVQNGADTQLQINADGVGNDFITAALITGGGPLDLATLISNGALVTDQSALA